MKGEAGAADNLRRMKKRSKIVDRHRNAASKKNVSFLWMSKYFMKIVQCDRLGDQRFRIVIGDFHKSASENEDVWGRFDVLFVEFVCLFSCVDEKIGGMAKALILGHNSPIY